MYNTWDYEIGDLIQVERRGAPPEYGVVVAYRPAEINDFNRKYWEYVSSSTGRRMYFYEIHERSLQEFNPKETKVKLLARGSH
jgi:hypothetical protein